MDHFTEEPVEQDYSERLIADILEEHTELDLSPPKISAPRGRPSQVEESKEDLEFRIHDEVTFG